MTTGEPIAIKLVNLTKLFQKYKTKEIIKAIGREVRILNKMTYEQQCPYIVKLFDCCKIGDHLHIVLEFCDGGSLEDLMDDRDGKLLEKDAKIILF